MKILQLLDERWDSGITAYALQIAVLLKKKGHHVVMGVRRGQKPESLAHALGLETVVIENFFFLRKVLANESWDVVNAHTGKTHTWAVSSRKLAVTSKKKPALLRTRGDARPVNVNIGSRFIYRNTDAVIAASQHIAQQYDFFAFKRANFVSTIYPAVQIDATISPPPSNVIGILGRLDPVKGHSTLLEAVPKVLERFPQAKFLVAGKEANISVALLQNQAKQLQIEKSIEFLGFQPSAEEFMRRCSIGVIASLGSEEVSRACLEWMAVGRPVVGTLVGCLSELIDTEETGLLVPPGDFVALANALLSLLRNPAHITQWGEKAHQMAAQRFSESVMLDQTLLAYEQALQRQPV